MARRVRKSRGGKWKSAIFAERERSLMYLTDQDLRFGYPGVYSVISCDACGFVFLADPPCRELLSNWYKEGYGARDVTEPVAKASGLLTVLRQVAKKSTLLPRLKRIWMYWR